MYKLIYGDTGKVECINTGNLIIPIALDNADFQQFLEWNAKQAAPLNLNSTIEVVVPPVKTVETFTLPIIAPDFIVQSPKPKTKHLEAHAEALAEAAKADKSIALIVLDLVVYIEELEKRLKKANI